MTSLDFAHVRRCAAAADAVYTDSDEVGRHLELRGEPFVLTDGIDLPEFVPTQFARLLKPLVGAKLPVAVVGANDDAIYVAFRGSVMPTSLFQSVNHAVHVFRDWIVGNLRFALVASPQWPGRVGAGFAKLNNRMYPYLEEQVRKHREQRDRPVILIGHSLGGAEAILTGHRLQTEEIPVSGVYVFGAPLVGNAAFGSKCPIVERIHRFEGGADIVPYLPPHPSLFGRVFENFQVSVNTVGSATAWALNRLFDKKLDEGPLFAGDFSAYRALGHRYVVSEKHVLSHGGVAWMDWGLDLVRMIEGGYSTLKHMDLLRFLKDHNIETYRARLEKH